MVNYLSVEHVAKSYGERTLFEDISFGINQGQKLGLIAKNGTGKTSLLDIISEKDVPDEGQVIYRNNIKVAFLEQEPDLDPELSIEETVFASENETLNIIRRYERALQNPEDQDEYQKAFDLMEAQKAWDFETEYRQILSIFKLNALDKKVSALSGGQKKRLALATILLDRPNMLILDEPTNHLDMEMIEWLEDFFKRENFTLLMVTHDRYFLERICNEIIELENGLLYTYKGNYSYYLEKKEQRKQIEQANHEKNQQLYKKELAWMNRQPKARTTKSKSRIEGFADIKERAKKRRDDHEVQLELNMQRLGKKVVELHNIGKSYDGTTLFKKLDYNFQPGERLGIVGNNGSGKSTFLNILMGAVSPDNGKVVVGETIKFGYYTQTGINIKKGQKVIDVIREFGDFIPLKHGRTLSAQQLLERFLFSRKKQYDYVEKLSGGEQKRLYLCTILIQNPNFLILDEPTNDLDIVTLNVLENFLMDFPGCLVVVSHDRYFMDKIIDHLFVFKDDASIQDFPGNYSDYREYRSQQIQEKRQQPSSKKTEKKPEKPKNKEHALSFQEKKEHKRLENKITVLEKEKERRQKEFNKGLEPDEVREKSEELQEIIDDIDEKTERWFELSAKMEDL